LNYTGKSDYMFGDITKREGFKTSWLHVPFVKLD